MDAKCLVLCHGTDTFEWGYSISYFSHPDIITYLLEAKQEAITNKREVVVSFFGQNFLLSYLTPRRYSFYLHNKDVQIVLCDRVSGGSDYPELHIKFLSHFLWRYGLLEAYSSVNAFVNDFCHVVHQKVSRADLCADLLMPLPNLSSINIKTRSRTKTSFSTLSTYAKYNVTTGYQFGRSNIKAVIYDKISDVEKTGKTFFYDLWSLNGWNQGDPVTRVELRMKRDFLRSRSINNPLDYDLNKSNLWFHLTQDWIRLTEPLPSKHHATPKVLPWWQSLSKLDPDSHLLPSSDYEAEYNPDLIYKMWKGLMCNLEAHGSDPVSLVLQREHDAEYQDQLSKRIIHSLGWQIPGSRQEGDICHPASQPLTWDVETP